MGLTGLLFLTAVHFCWIIGIAVLHYFDLVKVTVNQAVMMASSLVWWVLIFVVIQWLFN